MTLRSLLYGLALCAVVTVICVLTGRGKGEIRTDLLESCPSFEAENFAGRLYNAAGLLTQELSADQVTYFQHNDSVVFAKGAMQYYLFREGRPEIYRLSADRVLYHIDRMAYIEGHVRLAPLGALTASFSEISTPSATYDVPSGRIFSAEQIEIRGNGFTIIGSDYEGDLKAKTFIIRGHPHATYLPQRP